MMSLMSIEKIIKKKFFCSSLETAMGVTVSEANVLDKYRQQIHELGDIIVERSITPWTHINVLYKLFGKRNEERKITKEVHKFTRDIIASREKFQRDEIYNEDIIDKERHAMLDTLLIAKKQGLIDVVGIQEEVNTFIFEGYDTTMTGITFTLFMIAHHPDVQKKLYEEISGIYGTFNVLIGRVYSYTINFIVFFKR